MISVLPVANILVPFQGVSQLGSRSQGVAPGWIVPAFQAEMHYQSEYL